MLYQEWKGRAPMVFDHYKDESNNDIFSNNDTTETDTNGDDNNSIYATMA